MRKSCRIKKLFENAGIQPIEANAHLFFPFGESSQHLTRQKFHPNPEELEPGYTVVTVEPGLPTSVLVGLKIITDQQYTKPGGELEKHFSMMILTDDGHLIHADNLRNRASSVEEEFGQISGLPDEIKGNAVYKFYSEVSLDPRRIKQLTQGGYSIYVFSREEPPNPFAAYPRPTSPKPEMIYHVSHLSAQS